MRGSAGAGARTVYFHGHFDVVPAQSREQFRPRRENGRIVGRGSADMKGGLVSMLYGAAAAQDLGLLGDGRIVLHLVCDEETGSVTGSGHLRETGMIDPGALAMLTPEPTGGVVWHASRGAITLRVEVEGRPAHVGQAHLGVNAFEHMIAVAEPLAASHVTCWSVAPHIRSRATRLAARCWSSAVRRAAARTSTSSRQGVVLRRPALQSRGGHRRGARAADADDRGRRQADRRPRERRRRAAAAVRRDRPT